MNFTQKWLKRWNITQKQAGKALGVNERTIRSWQKNLPPVAEYAMKYLTIKWKGK